MRYLKIGGKWLSQLALAVLMAGPGTEKFTNPSWQRMFSRWGYPDGFYLVIGAIEVVAGIGLLVPRLASYCALLLSVVMLGAAWTQITRGGRNGVGEIVFASLLVAIAIIRWRDRLRLRQAAAAAAAS